MAKEEGASSSTVEEDEDLEELFGIPAGGLVGVQEEQGDKVVEQVHLVERLVLEQAGESTTVSECLPSCTNLSEEAVNLAKLLITGQYAQILRSPAALALLGQQSQHGQRGAEGGAKPPHLVDHLLPRIISFVMGDETGSSPSNMSRDSQLSRLLLVQWVGVACLNLYLQSNYTGPALPSSALQDLTELLPASDVLASLEVDGEFPYTKSTHAIFLSLSRALLHGVALPEYRSWGEAVVLDERGEGRLPLLPPSLHPPGSYRRLAALSSTAALWAARAVVTHRRLLSGRQPSPTLWAECQLLFSSVLSKLGAAVHAGEEVVDDKTGQEKKQEQAQLTPSYLSGRVWLEWGLAHHHFDEGDNGKKAFATAQRATGLQAKLTSALGKRTKYQQQELPQMLVVAKSAVPYVAPSSSAGNAKDTKDIQPTVIAEERKAEPTVGGEPEVAVCRTAVHGQDSILLEKTSFTVQQAEEENLHPVDQSVLLALCLDVANSNPKDGLTTEEMAPYVQRAMVHANNWMVYSTALMERAWLDFESTYSRERAVIQLQALVDQHTSRLTFTQSTTQSVEESAPVEERVLYLHNVVYPPQWELKRDLAERYAKLGVLASAAEMFLELELFDMVVDCYRAMDRVAKAERLVRDRLAVEKTPAMWTALGDLTGDTSFYDKAWELSNHRYARAKRSLGRHAFRDRRYKDTVLHLSQALAIMPLVPEAWFIKGMAEMDLEDWSGALASFTRCVQQNPDDAQAWGNIGAINIRVGDYSRAFQAFKEGVRHKRDSAPMWENYLTAAVKLNKPQDAIFAMHRLLDLRHNKKVEVDVAILNYLVDVAIDPLDPTHHLSKQVAELLGRVTSVVTTDARIWEAYARFNEAGGKEGAALDCRTKACRNLMSSSRWEREEEKVKQVVEAVEKLVEGCMKEGSHEHTNLHSIEMSLRSPVRLVGESLEGSEYHQRLLAAQRKISERIAAQASS